jgi:prophage antirepressor-like protein
MNTTITPYLFGDHTIRTVMQGDEPWFVGSDVCAALGIDNPSMAINGNESTGNRGLDDDEKGRIMIHDTSSDRSAPQGRELLVVNEPGLYRLVFKSRKAEARIFQRWVYHEVLPMIRKHGAYSTFSPRQTAYLNMVRELIELGISPDQATKAALQVEKVDEREGRFIRLAKGRQETPKVPDEPNPIDALIDQMEPGRIYKLRELTPMLPADHPQLKSIKGRALETKVGQRLQRLVGFRRLIRIPGKNAAFMLPATDNVVPMS